jgi:exosortase/archaeosortase family protein
MKSQATLMRRINAVILIGAALALALVLIAVAITAPLPIRRVAFCAPAAHLAGLLSGAPCVKDGEDFRLLGADLDLTVVPACAAVDYFCLLTGFLSLLITWRGLRLRTHLFVLPAAWGLTILINALRLIACWHTDRLAQNLLPPMLWPATHMAVGVVTFLTGLTFIFWLMTLKKGKDTTNECTTRGSD